MSDVMLKALRLFSLKGFPENPELKRRRRRKTKQNPEVQDQIMLRYYHRLAHRIYLTFLHTGIRETVQGEQL